MKLTKPITAHGESVTELVLREPTTKDIMEIGMPFVVLDGGGTEINAQKVGRYLVKLADIPMSSVEQLSPADFMIATGEVLFFFGQTTPAQPESATAA